MKKANYFKVLEEKMSLKENINFINSFDFFNNCLIIKYILAINCRMISIKVQNRNIYKGIKIMEFIDLLIKSIYF